MSLVSLLYRDSNDGTVPGISDWDYNTVIGAYNHYMKWRNTILENYIELFENHNKEDIEHKRKVYEKMGIKMDDYDKETERLDMEDKEWSSRWGWYSTLFNVFADGSYLKMKEAYNLKVIEVFNHLTYLNIKKKS